MESIDFKENRFDNVLDVYVDGKRTYAIWGSVIHHAYTACGKSGPPLTINQFVCPCGHVIPPEIYFLLKLRALRYGAK